LKREKPYSSGGKKSGTGSLRAVQKRKASASSTGKKIEDKRAVVVSLSKRGWGHAGKKKGKEENRTNTERGRPVPKLQRMTLSEVRKKINIKNLKKVDRLLFSGERGKEEPPERRRKKSF